MNVCAIMQPTFNPWAGYFDLIDQVDVFVFLDDVQMARRSWQVRNRVKTSQGPMFLTIPVKKTISRDECRVMDAEIDYSKDWRKKHLETIRAAYGKSRYFDEVFEVVAAIYGSGHEKLAEFNIHLIEIFCSEFGIQSSFVRASSLDGVAGVKDQRLASICASLNSDVYISPQGAAEYIDRISHGGELAKQDIEVIYHKYTPMPYRQLHGDFEPYYGVLDLAFNEGFAESLGHIRAGRGS